METFSFQQKGILFLHCYEGQQFFHEHREKSFPMPIPAEAAIPFRILIDENIIRGFSPDVNRSLSLSFFRCMLIDMNRGLFLQSKLIKILLVILTFLIILAIALSLSFTKIRKSIHDSQVIPLIKNHLNERKYNQQGSSSVSLFPYSLSGGFFLSLYKNFSDGKKR